MGAGHLDFVTDDTGYSGVYMYESQFYGAGVYGSFSYYYFACIGIWFGSAKNEVTQSEC